MQKTTLLLALLLVAISSKLYSQHYQTISYKSGENLALHKDYIYPSFQPGEVFFLKGGKAPYSMNFSTLTCQIEFINLKGDTLIISKPDEISVVTIDSSVFIYKKGFIQVLAANKNVQLGLQRKVRYEQVKLGAMDMPNLTTAQMNYDELLNTQGTSNYLILRENMVVKKENKFLLRTSNNEEITASKSGFLQLFESSKPGLKDFIKKEKTDFYKEADLVKLFNYCIAP